MDSVFDSVFSSVNAFVYRCRNDNDYTMQYMAGGVSRLIGYDPREILNNASVSYVGLTAQEDKERVFAEVDAAIEAGKPWDVAYRLTHRNGNLVWVREHGSAVYEDGELTFLQGLVVQADTEFSLRSDLENRISETRTVSDEIMHMTRQITGSVRQLSMLSINARIEAARSGEAGKGFAIVANEIKDLADKNASWADKIVDRISQFRAGNQNLDRRVNRRRSADS